MSKPNAELRCLALDLGAESGRAVVGHFDGRRLTLAETHRFPNGPVRLLDSLHWDALRLFAETKRGIGLAAHAAGPLASLGLDTWGVDFALLGPDGALLANPHHYRDRRHAGMVAEALRRASRERIYDRTGLQLMPINTLCQLLALAVQRSPLLDVAHTLLMMPDLFGYWLTGRAQSELTIATTSQLFDPRARTWSRELLAELGLPSHLLPPVAEPGGFLGRLLDHVAAEAGAPALPVVAVASHDTASAVVGTPLAGPGAAYVSSGTWSIVGVELPEPRVDARALAHGFSNEGGFAGTTRLCRNVAGLWLVQECRRAWAREGADLSYADLTALAAAAPPWRSLLDPADPAFLAPADMPTAIRDYCRRTGQEPPAERGAVVRCALESLALAYRETLDDLEAALGRPVDRSALRGPEVLHVVGGGSRNALLNQLTADATGRPVLAGPAEATSLGNVLAQLVALGHLGSLAEGREVLRGSGELALYEPGSREPWDAAAERYRRLRETPPRRPGGDHGGEGAGGGVGA